MASSSRPAIRNLRNKVLGFEEEAIAFVRIVEIHEEWCKVKLEDTLKVDARRVSSDPTIGLVRKLYEGYTIRTFVDPDLLLNEGGGRSLKTRTSRPVDWR